MIYYTNKKTNVIYAYESQAQAEALNKEHENLVPMSDELMEQFKNKPLGGIWTVNGWVIDKELLAKETESIQDSNQREKNQLLSAASEQIAAIQDAIDLDMAEDGDEEKLKEWKKYRILLNRVDTNLIPCEFPTKPE